MNRLKLFQDAAAPIALLMIAVLFFGTFAQFDPDPHHDGIQIASAIGVSQGLRIHADVYSQYGPIAPWLNAIPLKIIGQTLLALRVFGAFQLVVITLLMYQVSLLLDVKKSISFLGVLVWVVSCPVWAYQKWFFGLWAWPSITYMLFSLISLKLVLQAEKTNSQKLSHSIWIGGSIGIAIVCRPSYGIPYAFLLILALVIVQKGKRRTTDTGFRNIINALAGSISVIVAILAITNSLRPWIQQSFVGPATMYKSIFLGWDFIRDVYFSNFLPVVLCALLASPLLFLRSKAIRITGYVAFLVAGFAYFIGPSGISPSKLWVISEARNTENPYLSLSALRVCLPCSVMVLVTKLFSVIRSGKSHNQHAGAMYLAACCIGALFQLYPLPDIYHYWWTSPPLVIAVLVGMQSIRVPIIKLAPLVFLVPSLFLIAPKVFEQIQVQRVRWDSGILQGMLIDKEFEPSFRKAEDVLSNLRATAEFRCRDGIWSVIQGRYLSDSPAFVDWANQPNMTKERRSSTVVKCLSEHETLDSDLSMAALNGSTGDVPLFFSQWSGPYSIQIFERLIQLQDQNKDDEK